MIDGWAGVSDGWEINSVYMSGVSINGAGVSDGRAFMKCGREQSLIYMSDVSDG